MRERERVCVCVCVCSRCFFFSSCTEDLTKTLIHSAETKGQAILDRDEFSTPGGLFHFGLKTEYSNEGFREAVQLEAFPFNDLLISMTLPKWLKGLSHYGLTRVLSGILIRESLVTL